MPASIRPLVMLMFCAPTSRREIERPADQPGAIGAVLRVGTDQPRLEVRLGRRVLQ